MSRRHDLLTDTVTHCYNDRVERPRILVIDNNASITQMLQLELTYEGYEVTVIQDGIAGLIKARTASPDLLVIGWTLPHLSCLEICDRLRQTGFTRPIIVITDDDPSCDALTKRIASLKSGANDAISCPLHLEELMLRIQKQLRPIERQYSILRFEDVVLNRSSRQVFRNHDAIELTTKEFDLLEYFMMYPGQVLTRCQILDRIWGYDFMGDSNIIEVYVRYLRLKLEAHHPKRLILTVRGIGYVLR
jgi:DNA-binding response OmpR family regulator